MASVKKTAPSAKGAPKTAVPAAKAKPSPAPKASAKPAPEAGPEPTPAIKIERAAGRDTLCQIEILKDGHFFIARTETEAGQKEYKNTVFEDLLTEMVITLQEQLVDK
jgi:hypothetical protein